jgi:hypothetical protein
VSTKTYKVRVKQDEGWFIAEAGGLRTSDGGKAGMVTQARDLDELAYLIRDAIAQLTDTTDFAIELLLRSTVTIARRKPAAKATRKSRRRAA